MATEYLRYGAHRPLPVGPTLRAVDPDLDLLARVRSGDEGAFVTLVEKYHGSMLRVARNYVPSAAIAEEAVQDTWIGVVRGVEKFEGRSSFRTWLFRILINRARTAGGREPRTVPLGDVEPAVAASRFTAAGAWAEPLEAWVTDADDRLVAGTWSEALRTALDELPSRQREVVVLRDVEGLSSQDVADLLGVSEGNQRVLLHRGRSRLRSLLEHELTVRGR
jgi:RNA polymerase sigma-70 factor (ECF subfamily)